jgi:uncharacterized protein
VETSPFLEVARQGRNEWWRYVAGIVFIFVCSMGGQVMIAVPLVLREPDPARADLLLLALLLLSFAPGMAAVALAVRFLHSRSFRTLVTPYAQVSWKRLATGFVGWFVLAAAAGLVEAVLHPGRYQPNPEPLTVLPFLVVAALLIPIQAGTEELFYRGYLLQATGLLLRHPVLLSILNGLLFALPHAANPETTAGLVKVMLLYFMAGSFWAFITLRSGTLELALGAHTANNFFTAAVANYQATAIPSRSFFTITEIDANYQLGSLLVGMGLFYLVLVRRAVDQ